MSVLAFPSLQTMFDVNGKPIRTAKAYFYIAGTLSPIQVFRDSALSSPHTQPIDSAGNGRFPAIFANENSYRVRIVDGTGAVIEDVDGISGQSGSGGTIEITGTVDPNALLVTGDVIWNLKSGTRAGWVRCNGRSISSALGAGTERAANDAQALFLYLWAAIPTLAVAGGRGGSAAADWAANKALDLPDMRGRGPLGTVDMGNTASTILAGATVADPTVIGGTGGAATATAPVAAHTHTVQAVVSGAENQTITHNFSGTTSSNGAHNHDVTQAFTGVTTGAGFGSGSVLQTKSTFSTTTDGAHTHTFSGTTGGQNAQHNHTIPAHVTDSTGSAATHNNLHPVLLGTWLMRL